MTLRWVGWMDRVGDKKEARGLASMQRKEKKKTTTKKLWEHQSA